MGVAMLKYSYQCGDCKEYYSKIVSKYDEQLVRDGESSCFEKMFLGENFKCQCIRPP